MELAVNTFAKGLQNDTHPIVQGNDTLSDALNATFITMNGNEVVLLNDMGNRRVDNAYLPPGYEPVGIKEYGGIIYVASYNPVTNKSQIGSFPSPERRIGEEVEGLSSNFSLNVTNEGSDFHFTYTTEKGVNYLKEDSLLIPLTKDTSLHTGDKFSVYCSGLWDDTKQLLTNFDNVNEGKLISPKNKLFTLSLGILNSQNEFVDITSSLERWEDDNEGNNKIIEFEDSISDLYKFNSGYFIAKNKPKDIEHETSDDQSLIKNRLSMAVNTYSYKLIGPLYLKINYNHINSISYNINGTNTGTKTYPKAYLEITTHIEYNCPDGLIIGNGGDNIYEDYETKIPEISNFKFYPFYFLKLNNRGEYEIIEPDSESGIIENVVYDPDTNLYSVDIINYYSNVHPTNENENIIEYMIGVPSIINNNEINGSTLEKTYFIKELSQEGEIDISLLGSGSVELKEWRFNYNEKTSTGIISYGFQTYAKIGHSFKNLYILFVKCIDNNNVNNPNENISDEDWNNFLINGNWIHIDNNLTHGTYSVNINSIRDYNNLSLESNTMYNVYIKYDDYKEEIKLNTIYHNTVLWFATIDIFNNLFDKKFNFNDINTYTVEDSNISFTLNPKIDIKDYDESDVSGSLYSLTSKSEYIINNPIRFSTEFINNMSVNKGKVPQNIEITSSNEIMKIIFPSPEETTVDIKELSGEATYEGYQKWLSEIGPKEITIKNLSIPYSGKINLFMYAKGLPSLLVFRVEHNFISFGDYLAESSKDIWFKPPWIGIESYHDLASFDAKSSFVIKASNSNTLENPDNPFNPVDYLRYAQYRLYKSGIGNSLTELKYLLNYDILNNAFNSLADRNQMFIVADCLDWFKDRLGEDDRSGGKRRHCCLVWMRYREENELEDKWMLACEIIVTGTHGEDPNDDLNRDNPRIKWEDFVEYFRRMNYYSDFSTNSGTADVYMYDGTEYLLIKELLWNINLNIQYTANLSISDTISSEEKRRVNFYLLNSQLNTQILYPINILSSILKQNSKFVTYVEGKMFEANERKIDCYCEAAPTVRNLLSGHLYKITNGNATEVGIPNSTNIPYFPATTDKYPDFLRMEEEDSDFRDYRLNLKGVPVIEGLLKYRNYNLDSTLHN